MLGLARPQGYTRLSPVPQPGGLGARHSKELKSILFLRLKRKRIPAPAVDFAADPVI
jgi:hypothetical protein